VISKSVFLRNWFNRDINHLMNMFDNYGSILTYKQFMQILSFHVHFKEFNSITKAISLPLIHLIKSHIQFFYYYYLMCI